MDLMMNSILNKKKHTNLNIIASRTKKLYLKSKPFPHYVFKNFYDHSFLNNVLLEFPDLSKIKTSTNYKNKNEIKFANNNKKTFKKNTKKLFEFLNSKKFLKFLNNLTSIKEKLISDKYLSGGGLHEIKKGGVLKVHTDFNKHPFKNLDRRINVLIYLNKNWKKNYGGDLEFWDEKMKKCQKKIQPKFNTMVIFSTNDHTNHGHPNLLKCPKHISRKSIATYYFSKGRPIEEVSKNTIKNTTLFKNRSGIRDDVVIKNEIFKNFLRSKKIYQSLKKFEKKYIRTGKSQKKRNLKF